MAELDDLETSSKKARRVATYLNATFLGLFWVALFVFACIAILIIAHGVTSGVSGVATSTGLALPRVCLEASLILLIVWVIRSCFSDISKGSSPFTPKQVFRLRILALLFLAHAALTTLSSPALLSILGLSHVTLGVMVGTMSPGGQSNFIPINMGDIVLAIVLFCAALIVEYGSLLQQLSDDTV